MGMRVTSLRRYPVKSMGGESLDEVGLDARGLAGDRWYAVVDPAGKLASGKNSRRFRRYDPVFEYAAHTAADGTVQVVRDGRCWPVGHPELDRELSAAFGVGVHLATEADVLHHDDGPVSVVGTASLRWCAENLGIDVDPRRLRVNVLVETEEPFEEEAWLGRQVDLGEARLEIVDRLVRCRMVDVDQDGAAADGRLLKALTGARTGARSACLAVYADVVRPGRVRLGGLLAPVADRP